MQGRQPWSAFPCQASGTWGTQLGVGLYQTAMQSPRARKATPATGGRSKHTAVFSMHSCSCSSAGTAWLPPLHPRQERHSMPAPFMAAALHQRHSELPHMLAMWALSESVLWRAWL